MNDGMFTSNTSEWATPPDLVKRYGEFDLDPCATKENAKAPNFFTKEDNGLGKDWYGRVWMNPPYGRTIADWVKKAWQEAQMGNAEQVVCLLPARTDTKWFHEYCMEGTIEFLRGRIKFSNYKWNAPFPSMIVIFSNPHKKD